VIEEFAADKKRKSGEMPGVQCPKCNAEMEYKYTYEK
jgi:hypothetical protein